VLRLPLPRLLAWLREHRTEVPPALGGGDDEEDGLAATGDAEDAEGAGEDAADAEAAAAAAALAAAAVAERSGLARCLGERQEARARHAAQTRAALEAHEAAVRAMREAEEHLDTRRATKLQQLAATEVDVAQAATLVAALPKAALNELRQLGAPPKPVMLTLQVPSLYLPCTFPVPSLYLPYYDWDTGACTLQVRRAHGLHCTSAKFTSDGGHFFLLQAVHALLEGAEGSLSKPLPPAVPPPPAVPAPPQEPPPSHSPRLRDRLAPSIPSQAGRPSRTSSGWPSPPAPGASPRLRAAVGRPLAEATGRVHEEVPRGAAARRSAGHGADSWERVRGVLQARRDRSTM
jgi:hypothetical protein